MQDQRVKQAINKYLNKIDKKSKPSRKNKKPEKELESKVQAWCKSKGFQTWVVESKAVFSQSAGRYLTGQTDKGFSDIVGLNCDGLFVAIELKAPGRLSTLRSGQRVFLQEVITPGGFGIVTDSVDRLERIYQDFLKLPLELRRLFLLSQLPLEKKSADDLKPIFELG